jgi:hypothetical protein
MRLYSVVLTLFMTSITATASPQTTDATALQKVLQDRLNFAYGAVWSTKDPVKYADEFLTDDAIITASDGPAVYKGRKQTIALVGELMKNFPSIKASAVYTKILSPTAALQFVVFEAPGVDAAHKPTIDHAKSLYVWVKTSHGWRVAADHFSYTGMDAVP